MGMNDDATGMPVNSVSCSLGYALASEDHSALRIAQITYHSHAMGFWTAVIVASVTVFAMNPSLKP
ncbi:hypothetical protein BJY04DRAFT_185331 [Aspergillus karnatakaensis]|uniref:uncharacterized protein n=1 Tax=Aspergillus karnatakaensis TaxID=1810916 RepID=UPI003CCD3041